MKAVEVVMLNRSFLPSHFSCLKHSYGFTTLFGVSLLFWGCGTDATLQTGSGGAISGMGGMSGGMQDGQGGSAGGTGGSEECEPQQEECNGIDEDCDGRVDEDAFGESLSEPCYDGPEDTEGVGVCVAGAHRCVDGAFADECDGLVMPTEETCNGIDEDCDGSVDEGAPNCCPEVGQQEVCNNVCEQGTRVCNADFTWGPCSDGDGNPLRTPTEEVCDDGDNDCDGQTDENDEGQPLTEACYDGAQGTEGVGTCRAGSRTCVDGQFVQFCDGQVVPTPAEECDGVDNDCDGQVDEGDNGSLTQECYEGREGTEGIGPCQSGVQTCEQGRWSECRGQVVPVGLNEQNCDGRDEDCDEAVDEQLLNACGVCGEVPDEVCNGQDEDCDGGVDEGLVNCCEPGQRQDCSTACEEGEQVCGQARSFGRCNRLGSNEPVSQPGEEQCNGEDDDCDGSTDEREGGGPLVAFCYSGPEETEGVGICRAGTHTCVDGGFAECQNESVPEAIDFCDGEDDDCDGRLDEDNPADGQQCNGGFPGRCGRGVTRCIDGRNQCAEFGEPMNEVCNFDDDDCDGVADEGNPGGGAECQPEPIDGCDPGPGTETCERGQIVCIANNPPPEECNNADDDCDGEVDEGVFNACGECGVVPAEVCNEGDDDCDGQIDEGVLNACGECGDVPAEQCDGQDNDCDGSTDEGVLNVCGQCAPDPVEICNGLDDDCDGIVDEGELDGEGAGCNTGLDGVCAQGETQCMQGEIQCVAMNEGQPELCNGADDDCDGEVDNIAPEACDVPNGVGACGVGMTACNPQNPNEQLCVSNLRPQEQCEEPGNPVDEDCDGQVDEGADARCVFSGVEYERVCLPGNDISGGISVVVDEEGTAHFSRVARVTGDLLHSTRSMDGEVNQEEVIQSISRLAIDEVDETDIELFNGRPVICARDANRGSFKVAEKRLDGSWAVTQLKFGDDSGNYCELEVIDGVLNVAFDHNGDLHVSTRNMDGSWNRSVGIDEHPNRVGQGIDMKHRDGVTVVAHRDTTEGDLRVSMKRQGGDWSTVSFSSNLLSFGMDPSLGLTEDTINVFHGAYNPNEPDSPEGDVAFLRTRLDADDLSVVTSEVDGGYTGGRTSGAITIGDTFYFMARERQRHAIFGANDSLMIGRVSANNSVKYAQVENYGAGQQRHDYQNITASSDPFGFPVFAFSVDRSPHGPERGDSLGCMYAPVDTDTDGVPDVIEEERGLNLNAADTDGDGRTDGEEILIDGTNPNVAG